MSCEVDQEIWNVMIQATDVTRSVVEILSGHMVEHVQWNPTEGDAGSLSFGMSTSGE